VTDVAAAALTEEQVEEILEKCRQGAGIPVTNDDCKRVLQILDLPPCEPGRVCIYVGRSVADADLGVLLLHDGRHGRPACSDGAVRLCDGITVPVEVVTPLIAASRSPAPTSPAISEPADGPTESTTSTVDGDTTDEDTTDGDTMPSES
jgi:hypothetical protein